MTAPETVRILNALAAGGAEARFVGGCVRDAVLGRPVKDVDIATDAPPERVMALLRQAGIEVVPTGLDHGTVTALVNHRPYEITTLRRDVETDGRHARVVFTDDWEADAARRDLTINALSLSPDGTLHDPFGGCRDLLAGRVRFVGDPRRRIEEDVLRLLRWFRFYAHYGRPPPDAAALAACREMAPRLGTLSAERVRAELLRLLAAPDPAPVVRLMRDEGVLAQVLPEATAIDRLDRMVRIENMIGAAEPDPVLRLAALVEVDAEGAQTLAARLRLSKTERDRITAMAAPPARFGPDTSPAELRRAAYRLGVATVRDLVLHGWASAGKNAEADRWRELFAAVEDWHPPRFPLSGRDAIALGVPRGPRIGRLLKAVEEWWIAGDFAADRDSCLARLAEEARRDAG